MKKCEKMIAKNNAENTVSVRSEKDDYKIKSSRKIDIIIAAVSLLISIVLWLYVVGTTTASNLL